VVFLRHPAAGQDITTFTHAHFHNSGQPVTGFWMGVTPVAWRSRSAKKDK